MNENFDKALRRALRPIDPGETFTQAVLSRAAQEQRIELHAPPRPRMPARVLPWVPAALAASLLVAIILEHDDARQQDVEEGLRAREQVIEALRMTSEKLDLAYQVVHNQAEAADDSDSGA